jgi:hypothetical protein
VALRLARTTLILVLVVVAMESTLGGASRLFDLIGIRLDSTTHEASPSTHSLLYIPSQP